MAAFLLFKNIDTMKHLDDIINIAKNISDIQKIVR